YQFWLNAADGDAEKYIKIFTFLPQQEIEEIIASHQADPAQRILQKKLAKEVTSFVHGKEECESAIQTTEKLFTGNPIENLRSLNEGELLQSMEGVPLSNFPI